MYSKSQNVLFIHIPKTAGQTITRFFMGLDGVDWEERWRYLLYQNYNPRNGPPQIAHATIDEYHAKDLLDKETIQRARKFTVVRNPWDRLWSEWNFNYRGLVTWDLFFEIFPINMSDNHNTGRDELRHIKPQVEFIDDSIEVLRFENLETDFSLFCHRHGIPKTGPLADKFNSSHSDHYEKAYDREKIKKVADFYERDISTFGYFFKP